jgi:WD40 repeat protein
MDERLVARLVEFHERLWQGLEEPEPQAADKSTSEPVSEQLQPELTAAENCLRLIERVRRGTFESAAQTLADSLPEHEPRRIGRFRIDAELGSGGHGIVYLGWDPIARRHVALKTPHSTALLAPETRARFMAEGVLAARLAHPNIVPVFEVDHSGPECFIVSEYCQGPSLADYLETRHATVIPFCTAARWVASLADGVEHAHRHRILHRDLKPANVILEAAPCDETPARDEESQYVPRLTDFGLAKLLDESGNNTRTGTLLGTPGYMAPEQVDSRIGKISEATDVYGLGVILYELLTGRPPFEGLNPYDILYRVSSGSVLSPRRLRPDLPRDLEAICLRCLERQPARRYPSAAALAADLRRFLAGEMTWARPLGIPGRALKWMRRRPAAAGVIGVSVLAVAIGVVGAGWHFIRLRQALEVAESANVRAEQRREQLERLVYERNMKEAAVAWQKHDIRSAVTLLTPYITSSPGEHSGFLTRLLWNQCYGQPLRIQAHQGHAHSVDFAPDGRQVLTTGADGAVHGWEVASGNRLFTLPEHRNGANDALFSPDGRWIATADGMAGVRLWDSSTRKMVRHQTAPELQNINCLAWSPDSRYLAAAGEPGTHVMVWEVDGAEPRSLATEHGDEINTMEFAPSGQLLATASTDGSVQIRSLDDRVATSPLHIETFRVTRMRFSADGAYLATAGVHPVVKIRQVSDFKLVKQFDTGAVRVGGVDRLPQTDDFVCADSFGIFRQWDWKQDRLRHALQIRQGRIMSLRAAPQGDCIATVAADGSLCLWTSRSLVAPIDMSEHRMSYTAAFTPDSRRLVGSCCINQIRVFDTQTRAISRLPSVHVAGVDVLSENSIVHYNLQHFYRRGLQPGAIAHKIFSPTVRAFHLRVSPAQDRVLYADQVTPYGVRIWDLKTSRPLPSLSGPTSTVTSLACSPDETLVAGGCDNGEIYLWDQYTGAPRVLRGHQQSVAAVAFIDGDMLASASDDQQVRLWNLRDGGSIHAIFSHDARVRRLAVCPGEPLLATGDGAGRIQLWSILTGNQIMQLDDLGAETTVLAFSPDGLWLACGAGTESPGRMHLWHAPPLDP